MDIEVRATLHRTQFAIRLFKILESESGCHCSHLLWLSSLYFSNETVTPCHLNRFTKTGRKISGLSQSREGCRPLLRTVLSDSHCRRTIHLRRGQPVRFNTQEAKGAEEQRNRDPFKHRDRVKDTREHIYQSGEGKHDEGPARAGSMIPKARQRKKRTLSPAGCTGRWRKNRE